MPRGAAIIARNQRFLGGFRAPPVSTHCFYGTRLPSPRAWAFTRRESSQNDEPSSSPWQIDEQVTGDGDEVVDYRSLSVCKHWDAAEDSGLERTWHEFEGVPHGNMTFNRQVLRQVLRLLAPPRDSAAAKDAAREADASLVCEQDLTTTDRSATCVHVECHPIRNAVCVEGRCRCAAGHCSDMSDPDPPLGVVMSGMNALPAATCIPSEDLRRIDVPELDHMIESLRKSGAAVSMAGLWHGFRSWHLRAAVAFLVAVIVARRRIKGAPDDHAKLD